MLKRNENFPEHKQLICYDTTFNIGNHFLSTILAKNVELKDEPFFPICFFIHDRKRSEDHETFLNFVFENDEKTKSKSKLKPNANVPVVTDREREFFNFFETNSFTKNSHFCCTNHIKKNVELWVRENLGWSEVKSYKDDVRKLVHLKSLKSYQERKKELEENWKLAFTKYFDKHVDRDVRKNLEQDTKNFPVFIDKKITNNISEAFHSAIKRSFNAEKLVRTEHVLVTLFVYQVHLLQEFDLAFNHSGDYLLKPSVLNTV